MGFKKKKLFDNTSSSRTFVPRLTKQQRFVYGIAILCASLIAFVGTQVLTWAREATITVSKKAVEVVAESVGDPMETDEFGHINVMIVGYGGNTHDGGYLSDSLMVASYNPADKAVTFISIPRDLYVNKDNLIYGKINVLFAYRHNRTQDLHQSAHFLKEKVEEISGLDIPYYVLVDFNGFEGFIDSLGGVTVDVPYDIYDSTYPNGNGGYMTFSMEEGSQHMSGDVALMYARSRHDTSDFARSYRQQQIIKAVIDSILSNTSLTSIGGIHDIYDQYTQMMTTNITSRKMIGLLQYTDSVDYMFSFGLTNECGIYRPELMQPGCFLYVPLREDFDGLSVLIPDGASAHRLSFYDYINNFAYYVVHNQGFLIENARIEIQNGIDDTVRRSYSYNRNGLASAIATKMVKYGYNITEVTNADEPLEQTTVIIHGTGKDYSDTLNILKLMIDYQVVQTSVVMSGTDMTVVLGNDFMQTRGTKPFDYNQ